MKKCTLVIHDEVNASFKDLDPQTRRLCNAALKFMVHSARFTPAVRMGRWDGMISFFAINGNTYVNLLDKVLDIVINAGYEIDIEDHRVPRTFEFPYVDEDYIANNAPNPVWPAGHPVAGEPIELRSYQVDIIRAFLENPQSIQEIATGAGKTLLTATLSHLCEAHGRTVIIVPNRSLVDQTEADYKNLGLDVGVYYGSRKEPGHQHTICTWQSLHILDKNSKKPKADVTQLDIDTFTKDVVAVMVDETHMAKADVLKNLLAGPFRNIPIRWGLTGTVPKEEHEFTSILASLGPVVNRLAASDLMEMGVLSKLQIDIIQLMDTVQFEDFHAENQFLTTDANHLDWISEFTRNTAMTGNTLVLINRIETGKQLAERLPEAKFVYGNSKAQDRTDAYEEIGQGTNQIVIASYGVAAVGINIPRIFNLILLEPGKSFVRVIQSIGRGIRKAKDKDFVQIYDIASTCKFSAKHVTERKKTYKAANYPFSVKKVDYLKDLS
jgi:superfamily II DNA or RNA helicase